MSGQATTSLNVVSTSPRASVTNQRGNDAHAFSRVPIESCSSLTAPHKIFLWPIVRSRLSQSSTSAVADLLRIHEEGTPWLIRKEISKHPRALPQTGDLDKEVFSSRTQGMCSPRCYIFPSLGLRHLQDCTKAYFDTFNMLSPILDEDIFSEVMLRHIVRDGYYDSDPQAVLAFVVLALGQVSIDGAQAPIVEGSDRLTGGWRGGSTRTPPGLEFFNEAQRRMKSIPQTSSIVNVQISLLHAT